MKLLLHMNMSAGANDTHHIILNVPELQALDDLPAVVSHSDGLLIGDHLIFERDKDGRRIWKILGRLIVNLDHIGKIAEYNERS